MIVPTREDGDERQLRGDLIDRVSYNSYCPGSSIFADLSERTPHNANRITPNANRKLHNADSNSKPRNAAEGKTGTVTGSGSDEWEWERHTNADADAERGAWFESFGLAFAFAFTERFYEGWYEGWHKGLSGFWFCDCACAGSFFCFCFRSCLCLSYGFGFATTGSRTWHDASARRSGKARFFPVFVDKLVVFWSA